MLLTIALVWLAAVTVTAAFLSAVFRLGQRHPRPVAESVPVVAESPAREMAA